MDLLVNKIGIIGFSTGNGHPYSYSAIINGFSKSNLKNKKSNWKVIDDYLLKIQKTSPLLRNFRVTNINSGNGIYKNFGKEISKKFKVKNVNKNYKEFLKKVDIIILAHDDLYKRNNIQKYLEQYFKGPIFVDKILTGNKKELTIKNNLMKKGKIWAASGARFSKSFHDNFKLIKIKKKKFNFVIPNSWQKYGPHIIDLIYNNKIINIDDKIKIKKIKNIIKIFKNQKFIGSIHLIKNYSKISMYLEDSNNRIHLSDNHYCFSKMLRILLKKYSKDKLINIPKKQLQISYLTNKLILSLKV
jgi:hypothetical protein